jgi:hypothetical protein
MEVPLGSAGTRAAGGILAPEPRAKNPDVSAGRFGEASLPTEFLDELDHLPQPLEVEEVSRGDGRRGCQGVRGVVGRAESNGGVAAIGQTDNDIRAHAVADTDDGQLLSAERMMGMRDGHASRRELGRRGSALGLCPRSSTVPFRPWSRTFLNHPGRPGSRAPVMDSDPNAAATMPSV